MSSPGATSRTSSAPEDRAPGRPPFGGRERRAPCAEAVRGKRVGLGSKFVAAVEHVLEVIHGNAEVFQVVEHSRQIRRALTRTYPYAVYYFIDVQGSRIVVLAVLPAAMDPARWQRRR